MTEQGPARTISYEQFLREYDGQHAEWMDGEVTLMSPVSIAHMRLSNFLHLLLLHFLARNPVGELLSAPFMLNISDAYSPEPDLMFLRTEHRDRIQKTGVDGAADVVIEIVSPESVKRDYDMKYKAYEAGGVSEYWLIDPGDKEALFYRLDENNRYQLVASDDQGDFVSVAMPGFRLQSSSLWPVVDSEAAQMLELVQRMLDRLS